MGDFAVLINVHMVVHCSSMLVAEQESDTALVNSSIILIYKQVHEREHVLLLTCMHTSQPLHCTHASVHHSIIPRPAKVPPP